MIGAGLQATRLGSAIIDSNRSVLVCLTDKKKELASNLARSFHCSVVDDWKEVINSGVDAVVICVPPYLHAEISLQAMKKGIHVLCEKPISYSTDEALKMIKVSEEKKVILQIGFNHRYHQGIRQVKKWHDDGQIGKIRFIRSVYGIGARPGIKDEWRSDPGIIAGGQLMEQGIHCIDLMRWFVGDPSEVICFTSKPSSIIEPLEDNTFVTFRTREDQLINIHSSLYQWKNHFSFEVYGTKGYASVFGLGGSYEKEKAILGIKDSFAPFSEKVIEYRDNDKSWKLQWEDFVNSITNKKEVLVSGNDGYEALRLVFAAYQADHERKSIKLEKDESK